MMWSPLLGVQKPWWMVQGKRFQEVLLWLPVAAEQHAVVVRVPCRSGRASGAGQLAMGGVEGWRGVPPLWEVKVQ